MHRYKMSLLCTTTILFLSALNLHSEILWRQNWDNVPDFQTQVNASVNGLASTHTQAQVWNASDYRYANVTHTVFAINQSAARGNEGKGIEYTFHGADTWQGGSIGIAFSDPDINWVTQQIDKTGYTEIYYSYWLKAPQPLQFSSNTTNLWKGARMYAWDYGQFDWNYLYNVGGGLASHYIDAEGQVYKPCFFIPSWAAPTLMYWYAQYNRTQDGDVGTSYQHTGDNNSNSRLLTILDDGQWHMFEYHVALNTPATEENSIYELYVDGILISSVGSNLKMRNSDNTKIGSVILFDNYHKGSVDGDQVIYIDDMIISTHHITPSSSISIESIMLD